MNALLQGLDQPLAEAVGWALLHFLWQGVAIAIVLALSLAVIRRRSSLARYAVCCAALAGMGLFPVATSFWCRPIPVAKTSEFKAITVTTMTPASPELRGSPTDLEVVSQIEQSFANDGAAVNRVSPFPQEAA